MVLTKGHPLLPDAEDAIAIRPMVYLSFTFDHRVLDGRSADAFLAAVEAFLENLQGSGSDAGGPLYSKLRPTVVSLHKAGGPATLRYRNCVYTFAAKGA